ncbi:hypothetical protein GF326_11490 [Candidatus Bathyarchaeota archaeon]|nr:hypothetical protein [Candidatus Bathyarchaeota archaeon]
MEGKTMAIIVEGRVMTFLLMVIFFVLMYYFMVLNKDEQYTIRTMPALEAVSEAVGRAAEMGRPVLWTPGMSGALNNSNQGPQVLAAISILQYVTEECVKAGVHIQAIMPLPDALPLVEETMRTAYLREGKPEEFDPSEQITFISQQSPYLTGVLGYMNREKPASNILVGGFYYESVVIGEAGNHVGAMQIGGTNNTHQMPFLVATCDYMLLAEELFAAGAAISQNRDMLGSIKGEDYMKIILMAITGIGFILGALNITIIADLLGM